MSESRYIHDPEYHNSKAASRIVPIISKMFKPQSVLDVGCGTGDFLKIFSEQGITDLAGVDGTWLDMTKLVVPQEMIRICDLEQGFNFSRRYDVVLCLEVAEHLQESAAEQLVSSLVTHGDVIIFSAAIPYQGGQNHINEQWIDYWQQKFEKHNYHLHDLIRPLIWNDSEIFWWYRQNIFVCIAGNASVTAGHTDINSYVHPELYLAKVWQMNAYREWIDKIFSGNIEVELAQAILRNAEKNKKP